MQDAQQEAAAERAEAADAMATEVTVEGHAEEEHTLSPYVVNSHSEHRQPGDAR